MGRRQRWLLVVAVVTLAPAPVFAEEGAESPVTCRDQRVAVALGEGRPADQSIVVRLCGAEPLAGRVLHVLISGATYGSVAWDFPYQPERYSYVRALTRAGVATLNVDRLGIGASSHPDSSAVT